MAEKQYTGNKFSRAKAMMAMGLVAAAISLAPEVTNEAHAARPEMGDEIYHTIENDEFRTVPTLEQQQKMQTIKIPQFKILNQKSTANDFKDSLRYNNDEQVQGIINRAPGSKIIGKDIRINTNNDMERW